ncbi:MAG: recombinase family protein [Alphaproteobacteria bacterium]
MKQGMKSCAIYTRKSTDEGLDQDFNTLHAQREACEAYITSQRAEGWQALAEQYDDGGYSGGNMNRPALKKLIADIKAGKIQTVVVYKIDRLTRSLMDFSKLVEVFDEHNVTFVSVTQIFNTTTSMGRLTLNVLLSFAQFEREVTGERIRDKIAASKKKGMWMGGFPPLGYQRIDKKLMPHPKDSKTVQFIFEEYLKCGSMRRLKNIVYERSLKTPVRIFKKGRTYGGAHLSRGHLYQILRNPLYVGKVRHKGEVYNGLHDGIIDQELFDSVQEQLNANTPVRKNGFTKSRSLLKGLLYDCDSIIYSPTYTVKNGNRYSYYINQNLIQYRDHPKGTMTRILAHEIEKTITEAIKDWVTSIKNWQNAFPDAPENHHHWLIKNLIPVRSRFIKSILKRVTVHAQNLTIEIDAKKLSREIAEHSEIVIGESASAIITIEAPFKTGKAKNGAIIINAKERKNKDPLDLPTDQLKRIDKRHYLAR